MECPKNTLTPAYAFQAGSKSGKPRIALRSGRPVSRGPATPGAGRGGPFSTTSCRQGSEGSWRYLSRRNGLAEALNNGDMARAMMAAVLMRLPEPEGPIRIVDVDGVLSKAGFNPDEPRDERGRWTEDGDNGGAKVIPAQSGGTIAEPLIGPLIEQIPAKPVPIPSPTDIVPPVVISKEPASNPFPRRRKCVKEWADAEKFYRDLLKRGKLDSSHGNRGYGGTYDQCVRGQVSQACGGARQNLK